MNLNLHPKKFIFLIGIPGSGKTFYAKELSKRFDLKLFQEIPRYVIKSFNFKCGKEGPIELDQKIFEENKKRIEYFLKNCLGDDRPILCDGSHHLDKIWLEYRITQEKFTNSERFSILRRYEEENIFCLLDKYSIFIILDVSPIISIERQKERASNEPKCIDVDALEFVNKKIIEFVNKNSENSIIINSTEDFEKNVRTIDSELSNRFNVYL